MLGSLLIGAGFKLNSIFYVLASLGAIGILLTLMVPMSRSSYELHAVDNKPKNSPVADDSYEEVVVTETV